LIATIFITYAIVSMGVIAAFTWDALGFDRRDAMVLGPTPVSGATVVAAKLAALAALLLAGALTVDVLPAALFALDASNHAAAAGARVTILVIAAAIVATIIGSRRQQQLALTPSASAGLSAAARGQMALARLLAGRHPIARATAEFVVATLMRNRVQQAPIALNAAIAVPIVVGALSRAAGDIAALQRPRTIVLWIPLVL